MLLLYLFTVGAGFLPPVVGKQTLQSIGHSGRDDADRPGGSEFRVHGSAGQIMATHTDVRDCPRLPASRPACRCEGAQLGGCFCHGTSQEASSSAQTSR